MTSTASTLGDRLRLARLARGLSQTKLADLSLMKQSDVSKVERGESAQTAGIARLCKVLRVDSDWLEFGRPPFPDFVLRAAEPDAAPYLAHAASLHGATLDAPLLNAAAIREINNMPAFFRTVIDDDANAPAIKQGQEVLWSTTRKAAPGRMVLVRDLHGVLHVRQYRQARVPDQWIAAPLNDAFAYLYSHLDGIAIIGVLKGLLDPDD